MELGEEISLLNPTYFSTKTKPREVQDPQSNTQGSAMYSFVSPMTNNEPTSYDSMFLKQTLKSQVYPEEIYSGYTLNIIHLFFLSERTSA